MGLKPRRTWVGNIRADIKSLNTRVNRLLNYNAKHPTSAFLTPAQVIILQSVQTNVVQPLLAQTTLR